MEDMGPENKEKIFGPEPADVKEANAPGKPVIEQKQSKVGLLGRLALGLTLLAGAKGIKPPDVSAAASQAPDNAVTLNIDAAPSSELSVDDQVLVIEANSKFTEEDIGLRISDPFEVQGIKYVLYQGGLVQKHPTLGLVKANDSEFIAQFAPDAGPYLEAIYQIPGHEPYDDESGGDLELAFARRVEHFGIPEHIVSHVQEKRQRGYETGVFVGKGKNYGPFVVYPLQRDNIQEWIEGPNKGLIQRVLSGDAMRNIGRTIPDANGNPRTIPGPKIVPDEALLAEPLGRVVDAGGGTGEIPNTVEIFLSAAKTEHTDIVQHTTPSGKTVSIETRKTPGAPLSAGFNPETEQKLKEVVGADAEKNGFNEADEAKYYVVVLNSMDELPTEIPRPPVNSSSPDIRYSLLGPTGDYIFQRTSDGKGILYYIPKAGLNLNDPQTRSDVNYVITYRLMELTEAEADLNANSILYGQTDHLALADQGAVQVSQN